ncbi:MAG: transposase, partial [Piscirickettsiaceae bacterium]
MSNYGHIKKEFHNLLQLSDEKRIESLYEPIWINYPKTQDIIKLLTSLINRPKILRMQNLLIIGESNMGKTSIISQFTKANPDVVIEDEGNISKAVKPVVLVQFPASADERGLYISIIE